MKITSLKIDVLKQDILDGVDNEAQSCPIAIAVKRALSNNGVIYSCVRVNGLGIAISRPETETVQLLDIPIRAIKFIDRFDSGKPVKPFSFFTRKGLNL